MIANQLKIELATRLAAVLRDRVNKREPYETALEDVLREPEVSQANLTPAEQFELREEVERRYRGDTLAQAKTSAHSGDAKAFVGGRIPRRSSNPNIRTSGVDFGARAANDKPDDED